MRHSVTAAAAAAAARRRAAFAMLLLFAVASGCAKTSPAVGTWTGSVGPGSASLTLAADGTGTVAIPPVLPQQPVTWTEDKEGKISLQIGGGANGGGAAAAAPPAGGPAGARPGMSVNLAGTVSEDGKTMTVPFPAFTLSLTRQAEAQ